MRRFALLVALLATSAACTAAPSPTSSPGPIDHPTDETVILRIENRGGLMGPVDFFSSFPAFTLLGDGRVIVQGAQVELFPGPALPPVLVRQLTEEGIQAVLAEVASTGQFGIGDVRWDGANCCLADAQDTVFTLRADGREVIVSVYGLGNVGPDLPMPGITAAEVAAHTALLELSQRLATLESWIGPTLWATPQFVAYVPDAMRLLVRNADADPPDESGLPNAEVPWPGTQDPTTFGAVSSDGTSRCGSVTGDESSAWYAALSEANQLTRFVHDGHRYQVSVRQLLPGDSLDCAGLTL